MFFIPKSELDDIVNNLVEHEEVYENSKILVTGGTGFIGKWLVAALNQFNSIKDLNIKIYILTRNKKSFIKKFSDSFPNNIIQFIESDIRDLDSLNLNLNFEYIILGANDATYDFSLNPFMLSDTLINGTHKLLTKFTSKKTRAILHLSSGAVYGDISKNFEGVKENSNANFNINDIGSIYGLGKILVESILNEYGKVHNIRIINARCFAFSGPHLPLDKHFAFGNFINSAIENKDIVINGDGSPTRSYLYPVDLISFLLKLIAREEKNISVNVGSSQPITIRELANKVIDTLNKSSKVVLKNGNVSHPEKSNFYIPNTDYAKSIGLNESVNLEDSIIRTYNFYKNFNN